MMPRLLGAVLVVLGSSLYGLSLARSLHGRVRLLGGLVGALQRLESEIVCHHSPLPEALERIGDESSGEVRLLLLSLAARMRVPHELRVSQVWSQTVRDWASRTSLAMDEVAILESLGGILGRTQVDDQVRYIQYTVERLMKIRERREAEVAKESRLRIYFGVAGGVALAILLV